MGETVNRAVAPTCTGTLEQLGSVKDFLRATDKALIMTATKIRSNIIGFPSERVSRAPRDGATMIDVLGSRMRMGIGRLLNRLGVPAAIQPVEFTDETTKQHVAVAVDDLFVRLSVDGRDYYFDRLTGRFDGTGSTPD